ncbi:ECF transporter S component [Glutamicibacter mishrai]|uniref:general stress protein n=1 Tax=Glutamicibacter mishrai TaxID=1775880 RepID=UPI0020CD1698|nr:general stress protein [Glutamicibacter mishrai]UTT38578.1 ECF transporter S component [Glutamicibacter mishrai]
MTSPHGVNSISPNGLPRGELLGRYTSYLDAQKLVDYLADNDFPVASVSIVGNDVRTVERVTAKLSYPKVALAGAAQGGMMGLFVGLLLSLFGGGGNGLYQILSSIGLGMAIWMIAGVVSYSTRRGKRDFASSSQFVATSFDVVVDFEHAQAARTLASKLPMRPHPGAGQPAETQIQQQAPAAPVTAPAATQAAVKPSESTDPRRGQFPDLPDGRPRYGVRVNEPKPAAEPEAKPQEQPESSAHSEQQAPASEDSSADAQQEQDLSSVEPKVNPENHPSAPSKDDEPKA